MSLFLGYIHYMMFDKIKYQEKFIDHIIELSSQPQELRRELNQIGQIEEGPLEEIIDDSNIHSWLQERVFLSEQRLAFTCEKLIDEGKSEEILDMAFREGETQNFSGTPSEAYHQMTQRFLDGMPCDGALFPLSMEEEEVVFQVMSDLHQEYWNGKNSGFYWDLRSKYMEGLLKNTPYQWIEKSKTLYEIR